MGGFQMREGELGSEIFYRRPGHGDMDLCIQRAWRTDPADEANGQVTTLTYDKLGRMMQRVEAANTGTWI
jgi:hypothetical protein